MSSLTEIVSERVEGMFPYPSSQLRVVLCAILLASAERRTVYDRRQNVNESPESSVSNIAGRLAKLAERGRARCVEDDPRRRIPERGTDQCHPPDRSPQ